MTIKKKTAIIYCDNELGLIDGKTATGLVRHSEIYNIVGVIDSSHAGKDAGEVLGIGENGIPVFYCLIDALNKLTNVPDCYIYGKAPLETYISTEERALILEAMGKGMDIINGLHQFFTEDEEFVHKAAMSNVKIKDIRKPPKIKDLHVFTGQISRVNVPVIAVLGTDCACGKMTTALELNKALENIGLKSLLIATGQTALMQGARYGVSMDALVSQFVVGEIENAIIQAFDNEQPDIIIVEGQSSVSHPAFMSSLGILKGSMPDRIILQHVPARKFRCDFPSLLMPTVESEIKLIKAISQAKMLAITVNHENMTNKEIDETIIDYEKRLKLPTTDVLNYGCRKLVQELGKQFTKINKKINLRVFTKMFNMTPLLATKSI